MSIFPPLMWLFTIFNISWSHITTQQEILKEILDRGYDINDSPHAAYGQRTDVHVQIYINSFGSLNAAHMDYNIDTYLRQKWRDPRLAYNHQKQNLVVQDPVMRNRIWKPDTYFENVKDATIHTVTIPNVLFRIKKTGDVLYSMRIKMTVECILKLHHFPFDNHECLLVVSSYSNMDSVIKYHWDDEAPIKMPPELEIAQFDLLLTHTEEKTYVYNTGNFSCLEVRFTLRRQNGYHVLQTYIPTILIVTISWVSFWIHPSAIPGRVTLGVTTLLTLTTLASGIRQHLPPVSYVKAIDIWIGMCMVMVFGALLEFTLVNWLASRKIPSRKMFHKISVFEMTERSNKPPPPTTYINYAHAIDRASRLLFPGSFLLFNAFYWPYYLLQQYTAAHI